MPNHDYKKRLDRILNTGDTDPEVTANAVCLGVELLIDIHAQLAAVRSEVEWLTSRLEDRSERASTADTPVA